MVSDSDRSARRDRPTAGLPDDTLRRMETGAAAERKVYSVAEFNRRLATYVGRVRDVWVEGEISELRRSPAWATVFLTLKDARTGACLSATMQRRSAGRSYGRSGCRLGGPAPRGHKGGRVWA